MATAIPNPCAKPKAPKKKVKPPPKPRHGPAQAKFIESTRLAVEKEQKAFFVDMDWSRIRYGGNRGGTLVGKPIDPLSFYVKDIAMWIPHLMLPNYVPSCSKCQTKEMVDVNGFDWVENPKLLYGVCSHRYVDTIYYKCNKCTCTFLGFNAVTMETDAKEITGVLNFRMSQGFAVDENLYSFVISHSSDTTALIQQRLKKLAADEWMNDAACYFCGVAAKKVKARGGRNGREGLIDNFLVDTSKVTPAEKKARHLRYRLTNIERELKSIEAKAVADVFFIDVFNKKKNRNKSHLPFKGLGREKLLTLIGLEITSAKDLLACDGFNPAVKESWKDMVQACYDQLNRDVAHHRRKKKEAEDELEEELSLQRIIAEDVHNQPPEPARAVNTNTPPTTVAPVARPPSFSKICNPCGYNVRMLSKSSIDRIKQTDSQRRMAIQLAKMRNIKATVLKMDFNYKLPSKIKVCTGRGKAFAPFNCLLGIQNEDNLTVFWKLYTGGGGN